MPEQPKKSRLSFSLRTMIIGLTFVAMIAAFIAYQSRHDEAKYYHQRQSAPDYVPAMMDAFEVRWVPENDKEIFIFWEVDFPPHPDHRYVTIATIRSSKGKYPIMSYGPVESIEKRRVVQGQLIEDEIISASGGIAIGDNFISKRVDLKDAKIRVEIRIIDEFDNVLFHGLKESDPYSVVAERAKQEGDPVYSPSP
ncbi:hypothetical protein [Bremerella sp. P1]|uniref:hypothetical protein n=1 Tax=Bremerella sp. P1 TaxID=3026424 RepID=UPI002368E95D|nr:hypothetical protein [Bremerella sp. P1]WDI42400.1 hypothetical protein PSR63_00380 [Bremerella sp. P1]